MRPSTYLHRMMTAAGASAGDLLRVLAQRELADLRAARELARLRQERDAWSEIAQRDSRRADALESENEQLRRQLADVQATTRTA